MMFAALAGHVMILVEPAATSASTIETLVKSAAGSIAAQLPRAGFYVATVASRREADFITAMRKDRIRPANPS
ncbi:MAG: hypothetical protein JNM61_09310 [Zoogloeaceae bacterium]|nr:hypothetical protein [Zoogloeaceae bacterium]